MNKVQQRKPVICAFLLSLAILRSPSPAGATSAESDPSRAVPFIEAGQWNDGGNSPLAPPPQSMLGVKELQAVQAAIAALPPFPSDPYSGCHARAHLTYKRLEAPSAHKVFKVWIFAGQALAPALRGGIHYRTLSSTTTWDYHVAVAFRDESASIWVVDTLVSKSPLPLARWLGNFTFEGLAVMTFLPGEKYLFNRTTVPALDAQNFPSGLRQFSMARNIVNGNFYEYDGDAAKHHDGAQDLAADALAAALLKGDFPGCQWKEDASQALRLKGLAAAAAPPVACAKAAGLFAKELERWSHLGL